MYKNFIRLNFRIRQALRRPLVSSCAWRNAANQWFNWLSLYNFETCLTREGKKVNHQQQAQLVEALRYKPHGRGFNSQWCHKIFHWHNPSCGLSVDSASYRNEYQEYFLVGKSGRCVGLTTLPPSYPDCLGIWEPQHPGTLRACPGL